MVRDGVCSRLLDLQGVHRNRLEGDTHCKDGKQRGKSMKAVKDQPAEVGICL